MFRGVSALFPGVFQNLGVEIEYDFFGDVVAVVADTFEAPYDADEVEALDSSFGELLQVFGDDGHGGVV